MALDVLQNYAEATVTTSLNGTDAAGTSDTVTVSALAGAWVGLAAGQQMRVMDKADLASLSTSYEIMILTANASGAAGSWTVTRGAEGSTVKAHTANWTMVPADTAAGVLNAVPAFSVAQSGSYIGAVGQVATGANPSLDYLVATPVNIPGPLTADAIGIYVDGPQTGATIRLGIYSDANGWPDALILDAGTVDASTSGYKEIAITQTLQARRYWLAAVQQGAAATYAGIISTVGLPYPSSRASYTVCGVANNGGTTGALPSSFGTPPYFQSSNTGNGAAPNVLLKVT